MVVTASITGVVHFVGLVNVAQLKAGGMGSLGQRPAGVVEEISTARSARPRFCSSAHSAVDIIPMGWGTTTANKLCLTSSDRFRKRVKGTDSPDSAKGEGKVSLTRDGDGLFHNQHRKQLHRPDHEGARPTIAASVGYHRCDLSGQRSQSRNRSIRRSGTQGLRFQGNGGGLAVVTFDP